MLKILLPIEKGQERKHKVEYLINLIVKIIKIIHSTYESCLSMSLLISTVHFLESFDAFLGDFSVRRALPRLTCNFL